MCIDNVGRHPSAVYCCCRFGRRRQQRQRGEASGCSIGLLACARGVLACVASKRGGAMHSRAAGLAQPLRRSLESTCPCSAAHAFVLCAASAGALRGLELVKVGALAAAGGQKWRGRGAERVAAQASGWVWYTATAGERQAAASKGRASRATPQPCIRSCQQHYQQVGPLAAAAALPSIMPNAAGLSLPRHSPPHPAALTKP